MATPRLILGRAALAAGEQAAGFTILSIFFARHLPAAEVAVAAEASSRNYSVARGKTQPVLNAALISDMTWRFCLRRPCLDVRKMSHSPNLMRAKSATALALKPDRAGAVVQP